MNFNPQVLAWREKTNKMITAFSNFMDEGKLNPQVIADFIQKAASAALRRERFINPYSGTEIENCFTELHQYIQLSLAYEGSLVMIPIQASLIEGGQLSIPEFIEYLHDAILLNNGLSEDKPMKNENDVSDERTVDEFNALLDKSEDAAAEEDFENAIRYLDNAFEIADKTPLLIYDRINMINNRAYYNFCLGNYDEALLDCERGISEDPDHGVLYHTKAEVLYDLRNFQEALNTIDLAIALEDSPDKHDFRKKILSEL